MAELDLTPEEADELRSTIAAALSELTGEVADTDNAEYRRGLRHRRDLLNEIVAKLPSP